ncbi:hypothetical protein, partial [Plasmodium yoelii yoelii]
MIFKYNTISKMHIPLAYS